MGQGPHGVNKKTVQGNHSARKAIHKTKVKKRLKAKKRKRRKKNDTQQDVVKKMKDSRSTRHEDQAHKQRRPISEGSNKSDGWNIDNEHQNDMSTYQRNRQNEMISLIGKYFEAESLDTWEKFLNLMEGIVHISRRWLEKAGDITDILYILKEGGYCKSCSQAHSCLLKIIRKLDPSFARDVDRIFKNNEKFGLKNNELTSQTEQQFARSEPFNQEVNDVCPKPADVETIGICRTEHGISSLGCAEVKERKLNRKGAKHAINNQFVEGNSKVPKQRSASKQNQKRRKQTSLIDKNVPNTRASENDMMYRIGSFGQWSNRSVRTGPLIAAGFSCKDPQTNEVECRDCWIVLNVSKFNGKTPLEYHKTVSPNCKFVYEEDPRNTAGHNIDTPNTYVQPSSEQHPNCDSLVLVPSAISRKPNDTVSATTNNQIDVLSGAPYEQATDNSMARDVNDILIVNIRNPVYAEEKDRRESFRLWPHRAVHDVDHLANAGFFYTGTEDIVRCFYCVIGLAEWNQDDDPWVEHARHSPECPYIKDQKGQSYINSIQTQWARIYTPKHPQYAQMDARRRSYQNGCWLRDKVHQTPEQLAAAGFSYTGEGDCVRCFYCDGGLREWETTDDPWVEHARWFPFCKFVLKIKGQRFVQASAAYYASPGGLQTSAIQCATEMDNEDPGTPSFVDSCKILEQINPMHSAAAMSLKGMGYSRETIRRALKTFEDLTGRRDFKAVNLMEIIFEMEEAGEVLSENNEEDPDQLKGATASGLASTGLQSEVVDDDNSDDDLHLDVERIRKEIKCLKEMTKCKICDGTETILVFLPCGHIVTDQKDEDETDMIPWPAGNSTEANCKQQNS